MGIRTCSPSSALALQLLCSRSTARHLLCICFAFTLHSLRIRSVLSLCIRPAFAQHSYIRSAVDLHSRCTHSPFAPHLLCTRYELALQLLHIPAAFALHSRCICSAFAPLSLCTRSALDPHSLSISSAFSVIRCLSLSTRALALHSPCTQGPTRKGSRGYKSGQKGPKMSFRCRGRRALCIHSCFALHWLVTRSALAPQSLCTRFAFTLHSLRWLCIRSSSALHSLSFA